MAKRDPEPEPLVEDLAVPDQSPVGDRLRRAREKTGLSLEDIAAQTRIPQRHLANIELGEWTDLPAPTYTIGFAKSYAAAVGLDRAEIGSQLREEMGGQRFASTSADVFEPADPRRTMPRSLVIGAVLAVVVLIALMSWWNKRSLEQPGSVDNGAEVVAASPSIQTPAPAAAQGQVVLSAISPVWLQVSEKGGAPLFAGTLQQGQTYTVPATATAPVLKTGKPEALRINVGTNVAGPVGPAASTVVNVSLLAADLMKAPAGASAPAPQVARPTPDAPTQRTRTRPRSRPASAIAAPPSSAPVEPQPATNVVG